MTSVQPTDVRISPLSVVAPGVTLGADTEVEEFCLVGRHGGDESTRTVIGPRSLLRSHTVGYAGNAPGVAHFRVCGQLCPATKSSPS